MCPPGRRLAMERHHPSPSHRTVFGAPGASPGRRCHQGIRLRQPRVPHCALVRACMAGQVPARPRPECSGSDHPDPLRLPPQDYDGAFRPDPSPAWASTRSPLAAVDVTTMTTCQRPTLILGWRMGCRWLRGHSRGHDRGLDRGLDRGRDCGHALRENSLAGGDVVRQTARLWTTTVTHPGAHPFASTGALGCRVAPLWSCGGCTGSPACSQTG